MPIITTELSPQYYARNSFSGKAKIRANTITGSMTLYSYNMPVAGIVRQHDGTMRAIVYGDCSATTLRHIKEFLKQHGFTAKTKEQILADYTPKGWD